MFCISAPAQCRASIREERHRRQGKAHLIRVMGRDAGRPQLLQQDRLAIGQRREAAGDVGDRFAGADPASFGMHHVEVEAGSPRRRDGRQPVERQARRRDHRAAQEHRIRHPPVAEAADDGFRPVEVSVRPGGDIGGERRCLAAVPAVRRHRPYAVIVRSALLRGDSRNATRRLAAGLQFLGDQERQLQRLLGVQPRIAERLVAGARDPPRSSACAPPVHSVTSRVRSSPHARRRPTSPPRHARRRSRAPRTG